MQCNFIMNSHFFSFNLISPVAQFFSKNASLYVCLTSLHSLFIPFILAPTLWVCCRTTLWWLVWFFWFVCLFLKCFWPPEHSKSVFIECWLFFSLCKIQLGSVLLSCTHSHDWSPLFCLVMTSK